MKKSFKKKILIVCNSKFVFNKFIRESIPFYEKNNIECEVVIGTEKEFKSKNSFLVQMPTNSIFSFNKFISAAYKIYKLAKKNNYDGIIHNNRNASICSRIAIFFLNKKIKSIYFSRGMYFHDDQNFFTKLFTILIEVFFLLRTDLILSQNKEDLNLLKNVISLFNVKAKYIGNGVDVKKFNFEESKIKPNILNFCTICRVSKGKGLEDLLINFQKILQYYPKSNLTIIGGPRNQEDRIYYKYLFGKFNLEKYSNRIKFTGLTDDVPKYLKKNNIYIHPSKREGMPRSLIEAMSCGLVCISSNVRGSRELINNNVNGFIYKDDKELFKFMLKAFKLKKSEIMKLSRNSSNLIKKSFNQKNYLNDQASFVRMSI